MKPIVPNIGWYSEESRRLGISTRCPFANAHTCPRYYQSLSLLGESGFTKIDGQEDARLKAKWKQSPFWPIVDEQAASVGRIEGKAVEYSNFCPEVSFEHFGVFATNLERHSVEIDTGLAHERLGNEPAPASDPRWAWRSIASQHYSECPIYSLLSHNTDSKKNSELTVPDLKEIALLKFYKRFGKRGLVFLFVLSTASLAWWNWEGIAKLPGIGPVLAYFSREPIPHADPTRFSVVVANFEHDEGGEIKNDVIQTLSEFGAVQVLSLDRAISVSGAYPEEAEKNGHNKARGYIRESGANVLIWGQILRNSNNSVPKLYWTVSSESTVIKPNNRYPISPTDLSLPEIFSNDLAEVLKLIAVQQSSELSAQGGRSEADKILPFVERTQALLHRLPKSTSQETFSQIQFALGDALFFHGYQAGDNERLVEAIKYYVDSLKGRPRDQFPLDWAATQNSLGTALRTLGERESDTARLEAAVTAYRAALEEYKRERVPLDWAMTQNNLGNALFTLGERESGTARLEEAVTAYRAALEEYKRERVPLGWAAIQNNLGNALFTLGERESGTARLEEAVAAYRAALEEYKRERVPLDWAMTQNNLGNALSTLGERESGTARLEEAVTAFRAALEEYKRERVPLDWAMTQNNLGTALDTLGERESGTARLEEAVAAFRAALEEYKRERVPLDWAMTQNNLGTALNTLGERESGTARLEEAVAAFRAALEEYKRERVPLDWAGTQNNLGTALSTLGERGSGTARLEEAAAAFRAALEERKRERVPLDWALTNYNLGRALKTAGTRSQSHEFLSEALECFLNAAPIFNQAKSPFEVHSIQFARDVLNEIQPLWSKKQEADWTNGHLAELKAVLGDKY